MRGVGLLLIVMFGALCADGQARDYHRSPTAVERKAIAYMVRTLGDRPEASLLIYKGRLEVEGAKTDDVHPLRFFEVVLTDEKLKASMANLRRRDWVFGNFMDGMAGSFNRSLERDNLTQAQLEDFANSVDVDVALLQPPFDDRNWREFVSVAIDNVPRQGDPRRYDM